MYAQFFPLHLQAVAAKHFLEYHYLPFSKHGEVIHYLNIFCDSLPVSLYNNTKILPLHTWFPQIKSLVCGLLAAVMCLRFQMFYLYMTGTISD